MTVTLTYDSTLSRVGISATALAAADVATIERSADGVRWTTVRGATALPVAAGVLATHYDYEWKPNVSNTYRVRGVETGAITFVGAGAAATGNNASITPALPASIVVGDLLVILASIRNSGSGTVNTPAGWSVIREFGASGGVTRNGVLLGRRYVAGDAAPLVTFAGGAANADTLARMAAFRRADLALVTGIDLLNSSAANVAYPALTIAADALLLIDAIWKQDDYSAATARAGFTSIGDAVSTAGDDAAQSWWYQIQTTAASQASGSHTITGGAAAVSRSMIAALQHAPYLNEQTASVTPALTTVWLKSPQRPFLNVPISLGGRDFETETAGRGAADEVLDRSLPVAVTQFPSSDRYQLLIRTTTDNAAQTLKYMLASGDVLFLHAPTGKTVPAGGVYLLADSNRCKLLRAAGTRRLWTLQVREVAPPGPDVAYALSTWATVLALYGTWADLLAANATWADVLTLLAQPSEVIVP